MGEKDQESIVDVDRKQSAAEDLPQLTTNEKDALGKVVDMYVKALDDLVNVNSLFTMAVFIGLSFATPNQRSLEDRRRCDPDAFVAKNLVMCEVISFSCFLVSSLAAKSLKVLLNIHKLRHEFQVEFVASFDFPVLRKMITSLLWRKTIFLISSAASSLGVFFLTLSMVNVIQIRLGKLSCESAYTFKSVISLAVLVFFALMLYLPPMIYAALANFMIDDKVKAAWKNDKNDKGGTAHEGPTDEMIKAMSGVL